MFSILIPSKLEPNIHKFIEQIEQEIRPSQIIVYNDRYGQGKGYALREALKEATGNYFIFIDGDFDIQPYEIKKNPFDVYGWDKSLTSPGNLLKTKLSSEGPVGIKIGSEDPLPFADDPGKEFYMEVILEPYTQVYVEKVNDFKLFVPTGVMELEEGKFCSFKHLNEEGGYEIYELADKNLELEDKEIFLGCFFKIDDFLEYGEFRQESIKVEMNYAFSLTKKASVTVRKSQV